MKTYLLDCIPSDIFSEDFPATPENINYMYAVSCIDDGDDDLESILEAMNKHYAGPIAVYESGGCSADSNQELIVSKLEFDLRENIESHNADATLEAVRLGWIDADDYAEFLKRLS